MRNTNTTIFTGKCYCEIMRFLYVFSNNRYLYECIYGWLISTLSRADSLLQEAWNGTATAPPGSKGGRRQKPNKAAKRPRPHARDAVRLQALQQLAGGYFKVGATRIKNLNFPNYFITGITRSSPRRIAASPVARLR